MKRVFRAALAAVIATPAAAQSSLAACGPLPDSSSRQIIKAFGQLRVCLVATQVAVTDAERPREWAARGTQVIMETQRSDDYRRAAIAADRVAWTINGRPATLDSLAERWQKAVI